MKLNTILLAISTIVLLITMIACNTNNVQKSKTFYYDLNSNLISKTKFQRLINYQTNIDYCINEGINKKCFLINRMKEGELMQEELLNFQKELQASIKKEIDLNKPIRITYYLKPDANFDCLARTRNLEYTINLEEQYSTYTNLYIASPKYEFTPMNNEILIDEHEVINSHFFNKLITCSNYLLINPKGTYISCIGDGCEALKF